MTKRIDQVEDKEVEKFREQSLKGSKKLKQWGELDYFYRSAWRGKYRQSLKRGDLNADGCKKKEVSNVS